jgi:hypothetical protein
MIKFYKGVVYGFMMTTRVTVFGIIVYQVKKEA